MLVALFPVQVGHPVYYTDSFGRTQSLLYDWVAQHPTRIIGASSEDDVEDI
ncbi:hypothetical protein BT96DRAFT_922892 [Gymnopus androsaceus JB14]|uniref:Uncharacterized protein n=1 Tax=Gymnopus androsaceus JB14 TaxID=1447944 RepID=A0A6A4HAM7_9AGAR|nr:hypothetical protein BT96DRAFT_922892 [Gymnopus androsaceus JB14]